MSKKHTQPRPIKVADRSGDELIAFPAERHILTGRQREIPNPAAALAEIAQPQPSERARLRAATVCQEQREAHARREALALLEREDARRDAISRGEIPVSTVREELAATRRRPMDAPMATRLDAMPAPLAALAWEAVIADADQTARAWWEKWQFTAAFVVWSLACFWLGRLA